MRIVLLNTHDTHGGAARAIYRIHRGLLSLGEDSSLLVLRKWSTDPTVIPLVPSASVGRRARRVLRQRAIARDADRYLRSRPPGYELFSDDRSRFGSEIARALPDADATILNWVSGFVDIGPLFGHLARERRLLWRLPDMNAFTGGCHYDFECGRWLGSCGECPQIASSGTQDLSRQIWLRKKSAYDRLEQSQLRIIALSSTQAGQVGRSSLLGRFPLSVIPCAVETDVFYPRPRMAARESLGLPPDAVIALGVATAFDRPAKGMALLTQALSKVDPALTSRRRLVVLTVGEHPPRFGESIEHLHWGPALDDRLLALLYSAADLMVFPSVAEAFGQTIVEALACGLPIVGFDKGGMSDAVQPGISGFIAAEITAEALAEALEEALGDIEGLRALSAGCRHSAETRFSLGVVARQYQELCRDSAV